ncbi:MAG TPA: tRNA 2-thiouridine(34) synthase MnmA [Clostridia bacterium]|nr:tRNA 2-thiouridine(34) synthase MnmA [Clostridia bacterium]
MAKERVVVGMSGGVDSAVAALLLKEQGYDVVGLFMKNWEENDKDGVCTAETDYTDVRRVCATLDIPYYTVNLSKQYWDNVFSHFVAEYKKGRTPNPDVLCNREIKFGVFKEHALKLDADYIATGHYCGTKKIGGKTYLTRAIDENKDQTYFLNQVMEKQIENAIFPLQNLTKPKVREIAEKNNFINAAKKDSTGVCFIGERDFKRFLSQYIPMREGDIKTLDGTTVGKHNGVYYYTIGQHKGFGLGGIKGLDNKDSWYIIKKDVENNILYVNQGEVDSLYNDRLVTEGFNFITEKIPSNTRVLVRIRHRQPLQNATFYLDDKGNAEIIFDTKQRAIVEGQYAAVYIDDICIGGGVIGKCD